MLNLDFIANKKIGIAVSGGVDSMTLLHIAQKCCSDILAINIDHNIRKESKNDSAFVVNYCKERDIPCISLSIDVPAEAKKIGESIELTARKIRYEIFERLLNEKRVDVIALAHHLNDQTETVLMRIFRGTGIRGLKGINDSEKYIHPLLNFKKEDIIAYAKENNISYVEDETNFEIDYTRNFIRNKVTPLIKEKYPQVDETLHRLREHCKEIDDYLTSNIIEFIQEDDIFYLPLRIKNEPTIIIKYSIANCLRAMGVHNDIENKNYNDIISLLNKENNKKIMLPFNIIVSLEYDKMVLSYEKYVIDFSEKFDINKTYRFKGYEYKFQQNNDISFINTFDYDKLPENLEIRTKKDGDKFKPCNGCTKLLSDYLQEKRVPLRERGDLLLLAFKDTVYAVLGIEISDLIKIDTETKKVIKIQRSKDV